MQISPISTRPIEELEQKIVSFSRRMNADEHEFLTLIREFDIRQGWKAWHFNNCAEWLNFKCGISLGTAREKLRVALALFDLTETSKAFASGELSYSKARAMTRATSVVNESELLDFALGATASQVEEYCRQVRNADRRLSTRDANQAHAARYLLRCLHADGTMTINLQISAEQGELIMKAVEIAMERAEKESEGGLQEDYIRRQADALVDIVSDYLGGNSGSKTSTADHYQVMVHVDEAALRDEGGKSDLPVESVRRIACDASLVEIIEDEGGKPLNTGRKRRVVSPPLKRALISRDKYCTYPGCMHDRWLDAHHVKHWADGGTTTKENLLLLCSKHHRLLHEGGYSIQKDHKGDWYFRNGNGKIIANASRDACIREKPALYCVAAST